MIFFLTFMFAFFLCITGCASSHNDSVEGQSRLVEEATITPNVADATNVAEDLSRDTENSMSPTQNEAFLYATATALDIDCDVAMRLMNQVELLFRSGTIPFNDISSLYNTWVISDDGIYFWEFYVNHEGKLYQFVGRIYGGKTNILLDVVECERRVLFMRDSDKRERVSSYQRDVSVSLLVNALDVSRDTAVMFTQDIDLLRYVGILECLDFSNVSVLPTSTPDSLSLILVTVDDVKYTVNVVLYEWGIYIDKITDADGVSLI